MRVIGEVLNTTVVFVAAILIALFGIILMGAFFYTHQHRPLTPYDLRDYFVGLLLIFLALSMIKGIRLYTPQEREEEIKEYCKTHDAFDDCQEELRRVFDF